MGGVKKLVDISGKKVKMGNMLHGSPMMKFLKGAPMLWGDPCSNPNPPDCGAPFRDFNHG